jgi:hypothetical protein
MVGRYNLASSIPKELKHIQFSKSGYYSQVRGGLRIVPRRWVTIKEKPPFLDITTIHPDLSQQAKPQWANPPYTTAKMESKHLHSYLKSEFLIPFAFVDNLVAFIPLNSSKSAIKQRNVIQTLNLPENAQKLYQLLDSEYRKLIKPSASMKTLADNFTYNNRLLPTNLLMKKNEYMVVHNSIGSIVKSAVIQQPILLDNSLYYIIFDEKDEAYYLCGVLNSRIMTLLVRLIGSTGSRGSLRNIHKNPYNFSIPKFTGDTIQKEIAYKSMELEKIVNVLKSKYIESHEKIKPRTMQNIVIKNHQYSSQIENLDKLIHTLLSG